MTDLPITVTPLTNGDLAAIAGQCRELLALLRQPAPPSAAVLDQASRLTIGVMHGGGNLRPAPGGGWLPKDWRQRCFIQPNGIVQVLTEGDVTTAAMLSQLALLDAAALARGPGRGDARAMLEAVLVAMGGPGPDGPVGGKGFILGGVRIEKLTPNERQLLEHLWADNTFPERPMSQFLTALNWDASHNGYRRAMVRLNKKLPARWTICCQNKAMRLLKLM